MEGKLIRERLEETLDSQDLNYSLDVDVDDEDYIIVSLSYERNSFPRLGNELDDILDEEDYMVEMGLTQPEEELPNTRSRTFTLAPVDTD